MIRRQTDLMERVRRAGMTGKELAALLGVMPSTVSDWARGRRRTPPAVDLLLDMLSQNPELASEYLRKWLPCDDLVRRPIRSLTPHPFEGRLDGLESQLAALEKQDTMTDAEFEALIADG